MKTAQEYLESLRSMRPNVYMDGELVPRDDPRLMGGINTISLTYELAADPEWEPLVTTTSHLTGGKINRFNHVHQSAEDLMKKQEMTRLLCHKVGGCIQRCMGCDALNAISVVSYEIDQAYGTEYYQHFLEWARYFQDRDLVAAAAQTDVKGDRSKRPHQQVDPDLYVRVVERRKDGIVVRGAKNHITISPYAEEIVVLPTRTLTREEGDWAVSFAIPADHERVYLVTRATSPRPRKKLSAPIANYGNADSFVIFDDAFIPWERVFMCGEWEFGGRLALLFALYHRHSYTGCKPAMSDILMGAAALVAEYNGVERADHIRHKMADYISVAELVYAAGIASAVKGQKAASGTFIPDVVYCNAGRRHAGENIYHEHEMLADISGGLVATLPPEGDFYQEKIGPLMEKYIMRNPKVTPEEQHRCFRMIGDLICSGIAGVWQIAGLHGGGSPIMEVIAMLANYNLEAKKDIARYLAGIPRPEIK